MALIGKPARKSNINKPGIAFQLLTRDSDPQIADVIADGASVDLPKNSRHMSGMHPSQAGNPIEAESLCKMRLQKIS
jgi:hypothetical protein